MTKDVEESAAKIVEILDGKRAHPVLASVFNSIKCSTLYMEWTVNKYWGNYVNKYVLQSLERIYNQLVKEKHIENNPRNYNDGDDNLWYVPDTERNRRIIIHTSQNTNLIFIWDDNFLDKNLSEFCCLHIRRYYDNYEEFDKADKWEKDYRQKNEQEYKDKGILWSIRNADELTSYSDNVLGNPYPKRLSLDYYKKNKFNVRYGDGRDEGYVLSYERNNVESSMSHHLIIKMVLDCYVPCMMIELFNDEWHEFLSGWYEAKT